MCAIGYLSILGCFIEHWKEKSKTRQHDEDRPASYLLLCQLFLFLCQGFGIKGDCNFDGSLTGQWMLFDSKSQIGGEYQITNKTIHPPKHLLAKQIVGNIRCVARVDNIYLLANATVNSFSPFSETINNYFCGVFNVRSRNYIEWMQFYATATRQGDYDVISSCQVDAIIEGNLPDMSKYGRWTPLYAKTPQPVLCPLNSLYHYAYTHTHINGVDVGPRPRLQACAELISQLDAGCSRADTFFFDYSKCRRRQGNSDEGRFSCLASWNASYTYRFKFSDQEYHTEEKGSQYLILRNEDQHIPDNSTRKYFCFVLEHRWKTYGNESDPDSKKERYTYLSGVPVMCPPDIRPKAIFPNYFSDENIGEALLLREVTDRDYKCQTPSALSHASRVTIAMTIIVLSSFINSVVSF
ncbi:uncharacterized protein [Ptychodera flava]|uniref:uncharacterized protein n=1 Tax=Ptychodera flava TaxID=63121 RepID=UPI00396A676F